MAKKNKLSTSIVRTKAVQAEVVPRDRGQAEAEFKRNVAQFIEQKIAEAMAGSDAQFQPWFQPREITDEIRRRQTVTEQQKWVNYFKKYGCIVCSPIARSHEHTGYVIGLDKEKIAELRKQSLSWPKVAKQIGISDSTIYKFRDGKHVELPEAPEIGNGPAHLSLGMCTTCFRRVKTRLEATLRLHAPASHEPMTFMDSVRLAREALAPSLTVLEAEGAKDRRDK
jgi:predicted DNA-binding transcriptional regulator AlpA